jgi:Fe-S-cluster containining protein
MRECGECTVCCTWLVGDAYGHEFGNGKSCKFLCENGCSVHKARPQVCRNYFCAWAQELLPEEMRPDKCKYVVSVENSDGGQYLKIFSIDGDKINTNILNWFKSWSSLMNTPVIYVKENNWIDL